MNEWMNEWMSTVGYTHNQNRKNYYLTLFKQYKIVQIIQNWAVFGYRVSITYVLKKRCWIQTV